jgi:hypothetical protein
LAEGQKYELQNLVRNRFKQSQLSHSVRRLRVSFEAGYEAVDQLDGAVAGDESSKEYITFLLGKAPDKAKQTPQKKDNDENGKKANLDSAKDEVIDRPKTSIFDRPLPLEKLSGKRHIPVLFSANRIPVLRIKKPQPASLSRYIDQRVKSRQEMHDKHDRLREELTIARCEDEWDDLTDGHCEDKSGTAEAMSGFNKYAEPAWTNAVSEALSTLSARMRAWKEKNRIMAEKMQAVVDRETELYEKEKMERLEAKRRQKMDEEQRGVISDHVPVPSHSYDNESGVK